jgi:pSer/pThr/pTyr-binding forkhead associated (FHA) protein
MVLTPVRPADGPPVRARGVLVVTASPELAPGTRLEIRAELVAGRDPQNAISIPADGYASGRHARFLRGDQTDIVEDLNSTNGTYVNGQRLSGARPLRPGDVVTIGQTQLTYEAPT